MAENIARDASRAPLTASGFWMPVKATPAAFAGGTTNARGDFDGTGNPLTLFTVTGRVLVKVLGFATVNLAGATATLEVGISGSTAALIAQTTATAIDAGEIWHDASPDAKLEASTVATEYILNGEDIIETAGTANITSGNVEYLCWYYPLESGASVVAA